MALRVGRPRVRPVAAGRHAPAMRRAVLASAIGVALGAASPALLANPSGPSVAAGAASFSARGSALTITNTPGAIINWRQFSIGRDELTRFIQRNAASAVLNRVVGGDPSVILGRLESNGRVFLINPSGIAIGRGARIDVAGFVASSLGLSDADFELGRMRFSGDGSEGKVTNAGSIRTPAGGRVYLIAPEVANAPSGVIETPQGQVTIAAGKTVELASAGAPDVRVEYTAPRGEAVNAGRIVAGSGEVGIYGTLVKTSGVVSATRAVRGDGGRIELVAARDVTLARGSRLEANGAAGGSVSVRAAGGTLLDEGGISATGASGRGGAVELTGRRVGLAGDASVDVSGATGGGSARIGGGRHGADPTVQNAWRSYVGPDASVKADALASGDGGDVVVWSDDLTRFYGSLSARGGPSGGNGGFAEISSKGTLDYRGSADLSAPHGSFGTLLFDPYDITVGGSGSSYGGAVMFADSGSSSVTMSNSSLDASLANVILQAQHDISIDAPVTLANDLGFVAQAGHDVDVNAALTTDGVTAGEGRIHLEADSPHSGAAFDGAGQIRINAPVDSCGGAVPAGCAGGHITLIGGYNHNGNSPSSGGFSLGADVNAGAGGISVALSKTTATLGFYIGAGGNTQLSSTDTGSLKTTGPLVLGQATTAGDHGLGVPGGAAPNDNAILLTVDSITNDTATPIQLSPDSGSSFELVAGSGGITLGRALTTYQDTTISTTGTLTINSTLSTSDNNLTIDAANLVLGSGGAISTGSGSFTCSGTGCPVTLTNEYWTGGAGTSSWFDAANWSGNQVPTSGIDVTIGSGIGAGSVVIGSGAAAYAKSVSALSPVAISSGSLTVTDASTFSNRLTVSGGALQGSDVLLSGNGNAFAWSGGTIAGAGTLYTSTGLSGTLSNVLTLDRAFSNSGSILFSNATLDGSGTFTNLGTVDPASTLTLGGATLDLGTTATTLAKLALGAGSVTGTGSLTVSGDFSWTGGSFGTTFGNLDLTSAGSFVVPAAGYAATNSVKLHSASRGVTLDGPVSAGGSGGIVLSGSTFTNNVGSSALSAPKGRWLVWSGNPANDNRGGLAYAFKQYGATYGSSTVLGSGNGFLYAVAPSVTAGLAGTVSKVYDGTPAATLAPANYAVSGAIDGDRVTLNDPASGRYDTKNVGTGKTVSVSGIALAGASNGAATVYGYTLAGSAASAPVGTITAASLVGTITAASKVYDGTRAATITGRSLSGVIGTDAVSYTGGSASFADKNAGTGKTVTATGLALSGADAGNYTVNATATALADITPAVLTLTGVKANDKVYDAGTAATLDTAGAGLSGVIGGDAVTLDTAAAYGRFADKNVGTGKPVTAAGFALGGADGGNYTVAQPSGLSASITPAPLTIEAVTNTKVYDGTDSAAATPAVSGLLGGDRASGLAETYTDPEIGTGKTLVVSAYTLDDGAGGRNYAVSLLDNDRGVIVAGQPSGAAAGLDTLLAQSTYPVVDWSQDSAQKSLLVGALTASGATTPSDKRETAGMVCR